MNEAITPIARRILAVALTAALAACSGGGTSPVVPASGTQPAFAPYFLRAIQQLSDRLVALESATTKVASPQSRGR